MMVIYKYTLQLADTSQLNLPLGAEVLCVKQQGRKFSLWIKCDPAAPAETRTFHVVGTGHDVPDGAEYIDTILDGAYVWHIFEGKKQ